MSDQSKDFNGSMPPRQGPEAASQENVSDAGNLVTMYQAQQGGKDSFPVLQAFQDYIEAERKQARKRVVQLSIYFTIVIGLVVFGFLAAGSYLLNNMTNMQNKLLDVALAEKQQPVSVAPAQVLPAPAPTVATTSPELEASIRDISRALAKMQELNAEESANKKAGKALGSAAVPVSQNPELALLKAELMLMKAQRQKLEEELSTIRSKRDPVAGKFPAPFYNKVVEDALAAARKTAVEKENSDKAKTAKVAKAEAAAGQARLLWQEAEKKMVLKTAADRADAERDAQAKRKAEQESATKNVMAKSMKLPDPGLPVADKLPPVRPVGVVVPSLPKDMKVVSVPLNTRNGSQVPWRVFIPE